MGSVFKRGLSGLLVLLLFFNIPIFKENLTENTTVKASKTSVCSDFQSNKPSLNNFNVILKKLNNVFENGLNTERLVIDKINNLDVDKLGEYIFDKDITKYYFSDYSGKKIIENYKFDNLKSAKNNIIFKKVYNNVKYYMSKKFKGQELVTDFAIRLKKTREPCGVIGYNIENNGGKMMISIHYFIGKKYQKNGFAKEATINLTRYILKDISDYTLKVDVHKNNISSQKVANELIKKLVTKDDENKFSKSIIDINNIFDYRLQKTA